MRSSPGSSTRSRKTCSPCKMMRTYTTEHSAATRVSYRRLSWKYARPWVAYRQAEYGSSPWHKEFWMYSCSAPSSSCTLRSSSADACATTMHARTPRIAHRAGATGYIHSSTVLARAERRHRGPLPAAAGCQSASVVALSAAMAAAPLLFQVARRANRIVQLPGNAPNSLRLVQAARRPAS